MDAPLYLPASRYVAPRRLPRMLDTKNVAIADLRAIPAAWALVKREMPEVDQLVATPPLKPHLGNFSFRSLLQFGAVKPDALDRLDVQLRALGRIG